MKIYGDKISGNCLKVKWTADHLGLTYDWIDIDILAGENRTPEFLAMNPFGQVPTVELDDGRYLAQSNAVVLHLAEGSTLIPGDAYERARMLEFMFWEQYSHEPYVAVCRFQHHYLKMPLAELDKEKVERGYRALDTMEGWLSDNAFLTGSSTSCADISLVAYTRWAHEGGFELGPYENVCGWIERVETALGIAD
ncbi:MAG: glutathione S-transferase family protein [Rhodospirillaceae bacterium]|nr:glutathione S-transferase family protein [Rhodospirillaceae bacterium]